MVGANGMTAVKGGWGNEGSIADRTCEELDEVIHGLALILPCQDFK